MVSEAKYSCTMLNVKSCHLCNSNWTGKVGGLLAVSKTLEKPTRNQLDLGQFLSSPSLHKMSLVSKSKSTVGELYTLPFSPWSKRVLLAQYHLRTQVEIKEYKPVVTEWFIKLRAGWPSHIISAPAFFTPTGNLICEGHDIARILDAARAPNASTLFPPEHDKQLRELVQAAENICIYARGVLMQKLVDNPMLVAKIVIPKFLLWLPGISFIAGMMANQIKNKYQHLSESTTEQTTREALDIIRKALPSDGGEFLIGDTLTYADIVVGGALAMTISEDKTNAFGSPQFGKLGNDYADVKKWGDDFLAKYVTRESIAFPPKKYDAEGNVIS